MTTQDPLSESTSAAADPLYLSADLWQDRFGTQGTNFLAMTGIMRASQILSRTVDETVEPYGLTRVSYLFLMTLHLLPEGTEKLGRISRYLMVHPTTVTMMADQLESKDLVRRRSHPTDRRAVLCEITPDGRQLVERATKDLAACNFGLGLTSEAEGETLLSTTRHIYESSKRTE